ncbi:DUF4240 domain-containing protein [Streptomyces griseoaurantiacus]|uniref:DUF4240 domain-containing protein n=1 Tax=Streptomyces griseoaurantiacus TaxID=68213 RepID=UPI00368DA6C4
MPACRPAEEIVAAQQVPWDLMAESCTLPLRAAAHLVSGGCSDDGFDYYRGWLIAQGREVFETMVAGPDALAGPPLVQASAADGLGLEGEDVLGVAWTAHLMATGEQLPRRVHDSISATGPFLGLRLRRPGRGDSPPAPGRSPPGTGRLVAHRPPVSAALPHPTT